MPSGIQTTSFIDESRSKTEGSDKDVGVVDGIGLVFSRRMADDVLVADNP